MAQEAELEVPVLIVGGGVAGLTASMLLSNLGIPSLLVSRYPHTSQLPKAHILNQRTMEIFTDIGVAPAVLAQSTPTENMHGVAMYTGLEGDGPASRYARRIAYADGWGAGNSDPDYQAASACATASGPRIFWAQTADAPSRSWLASRWPTTSSSGTHSTCTCQLICRRISTTREPGS